MKGTIRHATRDVGFEETPNPTIIKMKFASKNSQSGNPKFQDTKALYIVLSDDDRLTRDIDRDGQGYQAARPI
jgi:hypothetical protein